MNTEAPPDFGVLIRRSRKNAGLTQEALAERAGVSSRTISDLERGIARAPRSDTLELLADALELSPDERRHWERERQRLAKRATGEAGGHASTAIQIAPLPVSLTSLIGREQEIGDVFALLDRPDTRLVTLTGAGGVGKTRLALAVAQAAAERYPAGTAFVNLAAVEDPALLLLTIASSLGLRDATGQPLLEVLAAFLGGQRLLLVLDNFEQIVEAAASVSDLLIACPDLTILVTSRMPLRIQGEQLYRIAPLGMPVADGQIDSEEIGRSDAVALFVERARAVKPEFQLSEEIAGAVLEVCRRLDGLPLAIELAAARTTVLSPPLLLQRIERRLPLLTGGPRDVPEHQRTLRNTIAWSYDLLTAEQQVLFQRVSVFRNGWTLEAAAAVAGAAVDGGDDLAVLDGLSALVEHNLVTQHDQTGGDVRFEMLATIREFAQDRLIESGADAGTRWRHARYYSRVVEENEVHIEGPDQIACLDLFEREHDNLRAALAWLRDQRDLEAAMNMAGTLGLFWVTRGHLAEGRAHLALLLELAGKDSRTAGRAKVLLAASWLSAWQGDYQEAFQTSHEALAICQELDDRDRLPFAHVVLGTARAFQDDYAGATADWNRAVSLARNIGDFTNLSRALNNLGVVARSRSAVDEAQRLFQDSLTAAQAGASPDTLALALSSLGETFFERGIYDQARDLIREAIHLWYVSGNQWGSAGGLESLAAVSLAQGEPLHATRLAAAAAVQRERISVPVQTIAREDYERLIEGLRDALGNRFESTWAAGTELTIDEAVAEALDGVVSPPAPGQTG